MRTRSTPKPIAVPETRPQTQEASSTTGTTRSKARLRPAPLTGPSTRASMASTASGRVTKTNGHVPLPDHRNVIGLRSRSVWPENNTPEGAAAAVQAAQHAWKGKPIGSRERKALGIDTDEIGTSNAAETEATERTTRASMRALTSRRDEEGDLNDDVPGTEFVLRAAATAMAATSTPRGTPNPGILLNHGLPTPSLSGAGSVNGSVTGRATGTPWGRGRLRRVSFANPIEMPPSPSPSFAMPTKASSTRQKRKLGFSPLSSSGPPSKRPTRHIAEIECTICAETKPKYRSFPTAAQLPNCDHPRHTCIACITTHTTNTLNSKGIWSAVTCPQCTVLLTSEQVLALVRRSDVAPLKKLAKQKALERDPNYHHCPHPSCTSGQIYKAKDLPPSNPFDPFRHQYSEENLSVCRKCKGRSCFRHKMVWHEGYSCERYEDSHPDAEVRRTNEERLRKVVKKCPGKGCAWYVEKDGGCGHMYCTRCQLSWNWNDVKFFGEEEEAARAAAEAAAAAGEGSSSGGDGNVETRAQVLDAIEQANGEAAMQAIGVIAGGAGEEVGLGLPGGPGVMAAANNY